MKSPGRRLGRLSRFYLANSYLADGDLPNARDSLVAFLAEERDPLFRSLALANLAVVYERMADWKKARALINRLRRSRPGAGEGGARCRPDAREVGDKQGAIAAYRSFLNAHPFAQQRQDVLESLARSAPPATSRRHL